MAEENPPSLALLKKAFSRPWDTQLPLHARVHRGLRYAIENFFEDGQRFFTEKELIEHLKVSQVTVRRAVYDLVQDGLLERRVAKGSFVRKKTRETGAKNSEIAVHLMDGDSSFLSQVLREIVGACASRQLQARIFYSRQSGAVITREGEAWNQAGIAAAILVSIPHEQAAELSRKYQSAGKPVVAVDSRVPGNDAHYVGTNNQAVIRMGLDLLTSLGHQRICLLLNESETTENAVLRTAFFESECNTRGLDSCHVHHCGAKFWENSYDKALQAMPAVMALDPGPTAIFVCDDPGAWAVLKWCSQNKIRVPEDLSVLGFGNDKPSAFTHPSLSTIAHPTTDIAQTAVSLLAPNSGAHQTRLLPPELMIRESTGPVA